MDVIQHQREMHRNVERLARKPVLRRILLHFYERIGAYLADFEKGVIVEVGSGIGLVKDVIPNCICTDLFPGPRIDRIENAYALSFEDEVASSLILFDVFHHLRYPGSAFNEFRRVLAPGGRLIIFEPCMSLLGLLVYGCCHDEPLGLNRRIEWLAPAEWSPKDIHYFAAQANAWRVFLHRRGRAWLANWIVVKRERFAGISYVLSGGYSRRQLYPERCLAVMRWLDKLCSLLPAVFATRLLVVLEKPTGRS